MNIKSASAFLWVALMCCTWGAYAQGGQTGTTDAVAEDVRKPMKKSGWKSFKIGAVQMDYPETWELDQSGQMMTRFILFAPMDAEDDRFKENVNLIEQNLADYEMEAITLQQYVDLTLAQLPNYVTGYTLIDSKTETRSGLTYHELVYKGEQGPFALHFKQRLYLQGGVAYILTFTAEADRYADYEQLSTDLLNAFALAR